LSESKDCLKKRSWQQDILGDLTECKNNSTQISSPRDCPFLMRVPPFGFSQSAVEKFPGILKCDKRKESAFQVHTLKNGLNGGRTFYFRTGNKPLRDEWIKMITEISGKACNKFRQDNYFTRWQDVAKQMYSSLPFQSFVVLAISTNFLITIAAYQVDVRSGPSHTEVSNVTGAQFSARQKSVTTTFDKLDIFFTLLFCAGVAINHPYFT
jgi:hypothetical protein